MVGNFIAWTDAKIVTDRHVVTIQTLYLQDSHNILINIILSCNRVIGMRLGLECKGETHKKLASTF